MEHTRPSDEIPRKKRRRWPWAIVGGSIVLLLVCRPEKPRIQEIGGQWQIEWVKGSLPEAGGGPYPFLHHRTASGSRQVDEMVKHHHYLGDDCLVYVSEVYPARLRAACGDHPPITLAQSQPGDDSWKRNPPDISTDPIPTGETTFVSVAEVKQRAQASR